MKQEEQKQQQACGLYVAPLLEVVHLQVERGFAASGGVTTLNIDRIDAENEQIESYTIHGDWDNSSSNSFWE